MRYSAAPAPSRSTAWTLWHDLHPRPGTVNMAIDQALLERGARGERWLRLYTWRPHCLSFGRNERALQRYDRVRIEEAGLDVVRRPTGGRAVWHARELTYAVAAPAKELGGLRAAYEEIHAVLLAALRLLGAEAAMAARAAVPGLDAGACFAHAAGGEILVRGRKVVGSAQVRAGGGLLQHGSILLEDDQSVVRAVTRGAAPEDGSAPLSGLLGRRLTTGEVAAAIEQTAMECWAGTWDAVPDTTTLMCEAESHLPHFQSEVWTWRA